MALWLQSGLKTDQGASKGSNYDWKSGERLEKLNTATNTDASWDGARAQIRSLFKRGHVVELFTQADKNEVKHSAFT